MTRTASLLRKGINPILPMILSWPFYAWGGEPVMEAWVSLFRGPGDGFDAACDIEIDRLGNVHLVGDSWSDGSGYDIVTIKYDSSGEEQWVAVFNGPANDNDRASAIALDESGNVFVTGFSIGEDAVSECVTICYSPSGEPRWQSRYGGMVDGGEQGLDVAVDRAGNVFVAVTENSGFATVKYDSTGVEQWSRSFGEPGSSSGSACAIALDAAGSALVTGHISYNGSDFDIVTLKYSRHGELFWVAPYDGPGEGEDTATAIGVDSDGNAYVTGRSMGVTSGMDIVTVRYDCCTGEEVWVNRFNGPGNENDGGTDLAVDDRAGTVYVTGYSGPIPDYTTISYSLTGEPGWEAFYHHLDRLSDIASEVSLDHHGNVCVTGTSAGDNGDFCGDYATVMYDATGVQRWVARYSSPGSADDHATAIATDSFGNVYVTGYVNGFRHADVATIKYETTRTEDEQEATSNLN
ncbi:MAG: SBBP repeat-containing protein [Candidatus Fermentibacteraceae bacterium]